MFNTSAIRNIFIAALLGAVILFIWCTISFMVLPWHKGEMSLYNTARPSAQTVAKQGKVTGIQVELSGDKSLIKATVIRQKPSGFSMLLRMVGQFIVQYVAAWLVALMLLVAQIKSYWRRVGFAVLFGLAAGVISYFPHWIWFGIPLTFTLVNVFDSVIGWCLAGFGLAWLVKGTAAN